MIDASAEDFDIEDPPPEIYDCGHTSHGLRKEYDLLAAKGSISTGVELTWSSAILCETCKTSINNNPDDPREVYPAGTREDQIEEGNREAAEQRRN